MEKVFGNILRKVGNSLGGDFESPEDKRKEKIKELERKIESVKKTLGNLQGFAGDPSNSSEGDHEAVVRWESVISGMQTELDEMKKN